MHKTCQKRMVEFERRVRDQKNDQRRRLLVLSHYLVVSSFRPLCLSFPPEKEEEEGCVFDGTERD